MESGSDQRYSTMSLSVLLRFISGKRQETNNANLRSGWHQEAGMIRSPPFVTALAMGIDCDPLPNKAAARSWFPFCDLAQ
jgi:hypothetical protein